MSNIKKKIDTNTEGGIEIPKTLPGTVFAERPELSSEKASKAYPIPTNALLVRLHKKDVEFCIRRYHKTTTGIAKAQIALEREQGWRISAKGASCKIPKPLAEYLITKHVNTTLRNRDRARDALVDQINKLKAQLVELDASREKNDKELVASAKAAKKKLKASTVAWQ